MNVRTLCLSILMRGQASGYEIRKQCLEKESSYFVAASYGAIYPALAKLEQDGMVTMKIEQSDGKPNKKTYTITDLGRRELIDEIMRPLAADVYRSPFLLFAQFANQMPASLVRTRLDEFEERVAGEIQQLQNLKSDIPQGHNSGASMWALEFGLDTLHHKFNLIRKSRDTLIAMAMPDEGDQKYSEGISL